MSSPGLLIHCPTVFLPKGGGSSLTQSPQPHPVEKLQCIRLDQEKGDFMQQKGYTAEQTISMLRQVKVEWPKTASRESMKGIAVTTDT